MKAKTFWLVRNQGRFGSVSVWRGEKPRYFLDEESGHYEPTRSQNVYNFCSVVFYQITGIRLRPGEVRKFKLTEVKK